MSTLIRILRDGDEHLSGTFDHAFAPAHNPWRHLGALSFLCLVIAVVSGIVAYALYDTSVSGAYESGRRLQLDPWLLGRLLRGMHRYSSDGFMLLTVLHLLREAVRGHFLGFRWYSWITGVPLLWILWVAGITGFWLLWDERALFSVTATAEWLQSLPLFSDQLVRNFLTADALNDRFFSLVIFIHIGLPLLLLAGVWIHVQRVSHARVWPPRVLTVGSLVTLGLLSLVVPAESLGPADTGNLPAALSLDWFYLFVHPLVDYLSANGVWLLAALLTGVLLAMPLLPMRMRPGKARAVAHVDLANCNGCARCAADCPFGAVIMVARNDQRHHLQQAAVIADMCAACGICVGSCPSSTPFRRMEDIVSGIELPDTPVVALRKQLQERLAALTGSPKIMLFTCSQATDGQVLGDAATAVLPLECAGMLPPSFIEYALRLGADGVVVSGCREGDCEFRLGDRWVQDRFAGVRAPSLRASVARDHMAVVWAGNSPERIRLAVETLRASLKSTDQPPAVSPALVHEEHHD
jgi:quinol-cytochrome oxidoreductase complex cytochrome b subunit/coenzyme F420-reducing hydrogenase delta subunit/Pyruvate/2-oxoacid:ferredoxin oxidoreductase delta subunit